MNEQQQNNFSNLINLLSLALGIENLQENRAQSKHNDVQAANDAQAEYLLSEINRRFDEQNEILAEQNRKIDDLLKKLEMMRYDSERIL